MGSCTGWPSVQLPQRLQTAQVLLPAVTGEWDDPSQQPGEDGETREMKGESSMTMTRSLISSP